MKRYLIEFSYDGSNFLGYQKQKEGRTIQQELEEKLTLINNGEIVLVSASGRTDAGVHAYGQCAHFDLQINIIPDKLKMALNSLLDGDIYIRNVKEVDNDFHARFLVKKKEYIYKINLGEYNPLERNYVYQYNKNLDVDSMKKAIKYFEGEHSFESFTKANVETDDFVRTIISTEIEEIDNKLIIHFVGTGFLRYMVRNIVGFLIEVGEGKRKPEEVINILEKKDRREAGKTAEPQGLYLNKVFY